MQNEIKSEFPTRPYYTLQQAANELNIALKRTDIDVDYLLQLGANGSIKIVTKSKHNGLKFNDTGDLFEDVDSGRIDYQYSCKAEILNSLQYSDYSDGYFLELSIESVRFFAFDVDQSELLQFYFTDFFPYVTYSHTDFDAEEFPKVLYFNSYKKYFAGFQDITLTKQEGIFFISDFATEEQIKFGDVNVSVTKWLSSSEDYHELKITRNNLFILNAEFASLMKSETHPQADQLAVQFGNTAFTQTPPIDLEIQIKRLSIKNMELQQELSLLKEQLKQSDELITNHNQRSTVAKMMGKLILKAFPKGTKEKGLLSHGLIDIVKNETGVSQTVAREWILLAHEKLPK